MSFETSRALGITGEFESSKFLTIGSYGSNLKKLSFESDLASATEAVENRLIRPDDMTEVAYSLKDQGNAGIAFSYNEPLVGWEYVHDCSKTVKRRGMNALLVTNGYVNPAVQSDVNEWLDAVSIKLYGFSEYIYSRMGGDLETVKAFTEASIKEVHTEITYYLFRGVKTEETEALAKWLSETDRQTILHIKSFYDSGTTKEYMKAAERYIKNVIIV